MELSWTMCARVIDAVNCGCQEFEASETDPMSCDCCGCHRHFHVLVGKFPYERGCCKSGTSDFCQCFLPSVDNSKKCGCCGCHKNFHEKVIENVKENIGIGSEAVGEKRPCPNLPENPILEPSPKRIKLDKNGANFESHGSISLDSNCTGLSTEVSESQKLSMPSRLKKNWEKLQITYPFDQVGEYYPKLIRKGKKKGSWILYCVPCDKEFSLQACDNLQNFSTHLKPKGGSEKSVHELALLSRFKAQKVAEEQVVKEASTIQKRKDWVDKHNNEGIEMLDNLSWLCKVCDLEGKFGVVDTIGQHIKGGPHSRAKKANPANRGTQSTIQAWMARGVIAGKAEYPPSYVPSVADVPRSDVMTFCKKNMCHGFYEDHIKIGEENYDISLLKNDLHSGDGWNIDPNYKNSFTNKNNEAIDIQGTFRHVNCTFFFCDQCSLIPTIPAFRKRVMRLKFATEIRGERTCSQVKLDFLQRNELINSCREWAHRYQSQCDQVFLLKVDLVRARISKNYLSIKLNSVIKEGQLPEIAELFLRVSNTRILEDKKTLYYFLIDVAKNLLSIHKNNGRGNGKRYHPSTLQLYEVLASIGGSSIHSFVSKNLCGPVLNTSTADFRNDGFIYVIGIQEETFKYIASILQTCKKELNVDGPVPMECSEDETKTIQLATWNRRLDHIDGFCGLKVTSGNMKHVCDFDPKPSAATFDSIKTAFENYEIGTMCRVLICNPLLTGMPRLAYSILTTCNKFDSKAVEKQWNTIRDLHKKYIEPLIGPLIGHGSDGDSRRRKLMLDSVSRGTYGIDSPSFLMRAEMINNLPMIMTQDPPHVGKKLRNPLLSSIRNIFWGKYLAHKNHLMLVFQVFSKEEHGLLEDDINVKDKQNFPAVQRLAFPKVRACLERLDKGIIHHGTYLQEHVKGTILHLEVIWSFLEIFYGKKALLERVRLASFVVHILYLGSAYIRYNGFGHYLKDNWMSKECMLDCIIACHASVCYIIMMRDYFSHLPIELSRVGSDCCEDYFSLLGQQVLNKHNFCIGEAAERTSHIARVKKIKHEKNGPLFANPRCRKNLWLEGNLNAVDTNIDFLDYSSVTDANLQEAWSAGFIMAKEKAKYVEMEEVLQSSGKWDKPWASSFSAFVQDIATLADEEMEDEESDKLLENVVSMNESSNNVPLILEVASNVRSTMLDVEQEFISDACDSHMNKVSPFVDVPEKGLVYKMRVISEMNVHGPNKLPLDRLRRIQHVEVKNNFSLGSKNNYADVGLFDDVAIKMNDGKNNITWYLARIQKIVKVIEKKKIDYVRAVPLNESGISVLPRYYKHVAGYRYEYGGFGGQEADLVKLDHVICLVALTFDEGIGLHLLSKEDKISLDRFVKECNDGSIRRNGDASSTKENAEAGPRKNGDAAQDSCLPSSCKLVPLNEPKMTSRVATRTRSGRLATRFQHVQS